ncbi:diacylglycerol kinase family protein [Aureibacillus halotolerans]|uniref:Undecaprenol kinase n=1 Tax=Aureibacillus halotolerans TaxID=1508390 RepID=A0A4R6UF51_9BACI|nr:diacylglycerol kinase family protein [Aureibacillus halotolerans]TDQ41734.1 undecaprenol kinase [Aureibacillus halotolerans]
MNTGSKGRTSKPWSWRRWFKSFFYAGRGISHALHTEMNLRFHFIAILLVSMLGIYFQITKTEWLVLILMMTIVCTLEMVNAAIERTVDLITEERTMLAQQAKDLAAGAVFLSAVASIIIGIVIFLPYVKVFVEMQ